MERKNLDRWEEKEFLTDWVKHAPSGSLDRSVDDILAELGLTEPKAPAQPVQPAAKPAQPAQPAAKPVQPAQPAAKPVQPAQPAAKPAQPAQPAAKPVQPAQPAAKPVQPAQPAAKPAQPAQPAAKPAQPAQPATKPVQPAQPATKPVQPAQPATENKPLTPYARPVKPAPHPTSPIEQAAETPASAEASPAPAAVAAPRKKRKKDKWIWRFLGNILPKKGDGALELVRKGVCICAILVLVGSSCVLLNDFVLTPLFGNRLAENIDNVRKKPVDPNDDSSIYPAGILDSFKNLYKQNGDTIGWITYKSTSPYWHEKLGNPGYVVVQSNDNDYYLHRDFNGNDDKNGTVFMDYRCKYDTKEDAQNANRITILYGHNMYSGLMFANVNKLLDSLAFAQSAPVVEFSSLFEENQYKVFAIVSNDTSEEGGETFLRTDFTDDQDFLQYIAELRLRSWYNYNDVDVRADDKVLMLYTCSNTYQTTMGKEGRTILVARKLRPGESAEVDVSSITENENKLMPRQWYVNNGLDLPNYYTSKDAAAQAVREAMGGTYIENTVNSNPNSGSSSSGSSHKKKPAVIEEDDYDYEEDYDYDEYVYEEEDYDDENYYYEEEPAEEEPVATEPPAEEPVEEEPVVTDPPVEEPAEEDPVATEPPAEEEPVATDPPAEEPAE